MTQAERKQFEEDLKDVRVRQYHAGALNRIFRGTIGIVTESQITPEVAKASIFLEREALKTERVLTLVLKTIQVGTGAFFARALFKYLLDVGRSGSYIAAMARNENWSNLWQSGLTFKFNTILLSLYDENTIVKTSFDAVNVRWKSYMGLLLYGIIDELPY